MERTGTRIEREVVVDKSTLYRSIRNLRGKLEWEGDIKAWRSARSGRSETAGSTKIKPSPN